MVEQVRVREDIRRVIKIGGSLAITIPKEYVEAHGLKPGAIVRILYDDFLHAKPIKQEELMAKLEKAKEVLET